MIYRRWISGSRSDVVNGMIANWLLGDCCDATYDCKQDGQWTKAERHHKDDGTARLESNHRKEAG